MSEHRLKYATLLAPLPPVLYMCLLVPFSESLGWAILIISITALSSYSSTIILGLPLVAILRRKELLNLPILVLSGTALGAFAWFLIMLVMSFLIGSSTDIPLLQLIWGAIFGFSVSICFGLIAGITWKSKTSGQVL